MQKKRWVYPSLNKSREIHHWGFKFTLPCSRWFSCKRGFLFPGVQKGVEERTGSLGHLVVWEDEEPGRWVSDNESSTSSSWHKATSPYLWCFGLADSQSLSEVGIHSIIGFPLSLGRLDPVCNDLDYEVRGNIANCQRFIHTKLGNN